MEQRKNVKVSQRLWDKHSEEEKCVLCDKQLAKKLKKGQEVYLFTKKSPHRLAQVVLIQGANIVFGVVDQSSFEEEWIRNHGVSFGCYAG